VTAFAVGADVRQEGVDAVDDTHQIDVEHPSPGVERDGVDAAATADTGVVANYVDVAERIVGRLGRSLDAGRVGDVAGDASQIRANIAQACDGGCQRVRLDVGEHHVHADLREDPAEREADAACSSRHEGCLAGEIAHGPPFCRLCVRCHGVGQMPLAMAAFCENRRGVYGRY
jgi:hypothetical protein